MSIRRFYRSRGSIAVAALPLIVGGGTVTNVLNFVEDKILYFCVEGKSKCSYLLACRIGP